MDIQHIVLLSAPQLGEQLVAARKAAKMTQGAVAVKLGVAQSRISELERRPGDISLEQVLAWCAALGMELSVGQRGATAKTPEKADW